METNLLTITPKLAAQILKSNTNNRAISESKVRQYAHDMISGKWHLTHQGIAITLSNNVGDGQHRLHAIIRSNMTIDMNITTGIDDNAFKFIDIGYNRTIAQCMSIADITNYTSHSSGIGKYFQLKMSDKITSNSRNKEYHIMADDFIIEYNNNKSFYDEANVLSGKYYTKFRILKKSLIYGYFSYLHLEKKHSIIKIKSFFDKIYCIDNDYDKSKSPKLLFDFLIRDLTSNRKIIDTVRNALIIKAWNCYFLNKEIAILRFDSERENYPVIL